MLNKDEYWIHLPTGIRGTISWEPDHQYGHFHSTNGLEFTIFHKEVVSLKELEATQ